MGVNVKVGSRCRLFYMGKEYPAVIKEIRSRSKNFLVQFDKNGTTMKIWKSARELSPASPLQDDARPSEIKILGVDNGTDQ